MKHKLIMVIAAAAALLVIVTAATWLAIPRSAPNAGLIPVTGPSNSGELPANNIAQQDPAVANSKCYPHRQIPRRGVYLEPAVSSIRQQ